MEAPPCSSLTDRQASSGKMWQEIQDSQEKCALVPRLDRNSATALLAANFDRLALAARFLPDDTIHPCQFLDQNKMLAGLLGPETTNFLRSFETIQKQGDRFTFTTASDMNYKIDKTAPGTMGLVKVDSVQFGKSFAFSIKEDAHGHTEFKDIKGIHTIVSTPLGKDRAPITDMVITRDSNGEPVFTVKADNPIKLSRIVGAPPEITVAVQMDRNGGIKVLDKNGHNRESRNKLAADLDGYIDIVEKILH